jgi:hypothetical protein
MQVGEEYDNKCLNTGIFVGVSHIACYNLFL